MYVIYGKFRIVNVIETTFIKELKGFQFHNTWVQVQEKLPECMQEKNRTRWQPYSAALRIQRQWKLYLREKNGGVELAITVHSF